MAQQRNIKSRLTLTWFSQLPIVIVTLLSFILLGCGGGGSGHNNAASPSEKASLRAALAKPLGKQTACPMLQASMDHAVPGSVITLTGFPSALGEPGFRVIAQTPDGELIAPLFANADSPTNTIQFTTPLYPGNNPEGGKVQLELGDGDIRCQHLAFTIDPLPTAPADYAETVQADLEAWVDKTLRR